MGKITVEVKNGSTEIVTEFVEQQLEEMNVSMKTSVKLMVALDEIFSNIQKYSGAEKADISVELEGDMVVIVFEDDGMMYNPLQKEDPDISQSLEERNIGGLGIYMVKKSMDAIEYENKEGKNVLILKKKQ